MNAQQVKDLILAIDVLITQRINNPNDTFEQFTERREKVIKQALMAMKVKVEDEHKIAREALEKCEALSE